MLDNYLPKALNNLLQQKLAHKKKSCTQQIKLPYHRARVKRILYGNMGVIRWGTRGTCPPHFLRRGT